MGLKMILMIWPKSAKISRLLKKKKENIKVYLKSDKKIRYKY